MEDTKICLVTNRSIGPVTYQILDEGITRTLAPRETRKIMFGELDKLAMQPGGRELLKNYLFVQDSEVIEEITNQKQEPEYYLKEEDIPKWINESTLDEFKDALDFAPEGIKDLIKKISVSNELNDMNKRQALLDQLGFDVSAAIQHAKEDKEGDETVTKPTERRAGETSGRRVSKYNVVG